LLEPGQKRSVVACFILVGEETGYLSSFDIGREVVDVSGFFGDQVILINSELVDIGFRFDVAGLVGVDAAGEFLKNRVVLKDVIFVDFLDI